jgi:hypothetical protein
MRRFHQFILLLASLSAVSPATASVDVANKPMRFLNGLTEGLSTVKGNLGQTVR